MVTSGESLNKVSFWEMSFWSICLTRIDNQNVLVLVNCYIEISDKKKETTKSLNLL